MRNILLLTALLIGNYVKSFSQKEANPILYITISASYSFQSTQYLDELISLDPRFKTLSDTYHFSLTKAIPINDVRLSKMEQAAIKLTGNASSVAKLRRILRVGFTNPPNTSELTELVRQLNQIKLVEYCSLIPATPVPPPFDILPTTPGLVAQQIYINADPGVNMIYAWNLGLNGSGIKVKDIEYGFNKSHEEFNDRNVFIAPGMNVSTDAGSIYTDHGTYVMGIVYGGNAGYGITGLAYGATEVLLFPEWQQAGWDRINAASKAIENANPGDILIYEMQDENGAPAETEMVLWDLTKAATDSGLLIVAAAGNGNENLDSSFYDDYRSRGNSGAIIVGSGTPDTSHNKFASSTYGTRLDLQGWGDDVLTSGNAYGSVYVFGGDINQSYGYFNSTSAATAMIASCAIVLQSYYKSVTGNSLSPQQMRNILIDSGIPQGPLNHSQHVGPLPNMQNSINNINEQYLSDNEYAPKMISIYPNPTSDLIFIKNLSDGQIKQVKANVYSIEGKNIMPNAIINYDSSLDVRSLQKGVYILELICGENKIYKKIFKR